MAIIYTNQKSKEKAGLGKAQAAKQQEQLI